MAVGFGHVCSADLHCSVCADEGLKTRGPGAVAVLAHECPGVVGMPGWCPVPAALLPWAQLFVCGAGAAHCSGNRAA